MYIIMQGVVGNIRDNLNKFSSVYQRTRTSLIKQLEVGKKPEKSSFRLYPCRISGLPQILTIIVSNHGPSRRRNRQIILRSPILLIR
jgi:hypothetical protein